MSDRKLSAFTNTIWSAFGNNVPSKAVSSSSKKPSYESINIEFVNDDNFVDGSLLDYTNHELTQEQLRNITNHFVK